MAQKSTRFSVICSELAEEVSGIGVLQRRLYPLLESQCIDVETSTVSLRATNVPERIARLAFTFIRPISPSARFLSVVSPFPLFAPSKSVAFVHDLRWFRTRGRLARAYRGWDLRRTVKRARTIICISERTRDDLALYLPSSREKAQVVWLGPGIVPTGSFCPRDSGIVLLIGGAAHKRNEFAARMLAEAKPSWLVSVEGVGVSQETRGILEAALGEDQCRWHDRVSDEELLSIYVRAEYFVLFSREEGFGMPYVEALATGCKVIAIDQQLTRELLGQAGCLIRESSSDSIVEQLRHIVIPAPEVRQLQASRYSWVKCAEALASALRALD